MCIIRNIRYSFEDKRVPRKNSHEWTFQSKYCILYGHLRNVCHWLTLTNVNQSCLKEYPNTYIPVSSDLRYEIDATPPLYDELNFCKLSVP